MKKILVLAAAASMLAAFTAAAADASLTLDVLSAYVTHGQVVNDEAVFQPSIDIEGPFGFGFNVWASMNLTDNEDCDFPDSAGKFGEYNFDLNWTLPWEGPVSLTLGGIICVYPLEESEVEEDEDGEYAASKAPADGEKIVYATLAAEDLPLSPSITVHHSTRHTDDWLVKLAIGHSFDITDALSLDLGAEVCYAGKYYVVADYGSNAGSTWGNAQFDAALNYAVSDDLSLGLTASFSTILDSDVRDDIKEIGYYPEVDIFFGGLTATYNF